MSAFNGEIHHTLGSHHILIVWQTRLLGSLQQTNRKEQLRKHPSA